MTRTWIKVLGGAVAVGAGLVGWTALATRVNEGLVPADGRFIDVSGARLHYTDQGSGPVLVLIHGLMGQLRNFSYAVTDQLKDSYRIINIDRPGWGYSTLTDEAARPGIPEQAAMIDELLDRLEIAQATIVGHSLGGAVALALALDHPARVANLALISPLTGPQDMPPEAFRGLMVPQPLSRIISWTIAIPLATLTGPASMASVFAPDLPPADFGTRGGGALGMRPQSFRAGAAELLRANDEMTALTARYGEINVPVSILFGRADNVLKSDAHGERTAETLARGELTLIAGGHMLPVTHPRETVSFIRSAAARII